MKRIFSVFLLLLALAAMAYAFLKVAVINGPFMIIVGCSTFLTLMSGILAGLGQGNADLAAAKLKIRELTESVANLGDANDGLKATFDAKVAAAVAAFKAGQASVPAPGSPAPTNGAGHVANA